MVELPVEEPRTIVIPRDLLLHQLDNHNHSLLDSSKVGVLHRQVGVGQAELQTYQRRMTMWMAAKQELDPGH
jgi:hypothetical protein